MTQDKSSKLTQFVRDSISGKVKYLSGGPTTTGSLATIIKTPDSKDYASIAAEAINREIVDAENISWAGLVAEVKKIADAIA